ncbi:ArsR family transcriptional regulator [Saliphagus sp. LR7]|uniref:DUF7344 domain-containing protein n=1 Tax=Saliphagus sp. LR7 TaxID=2282654 RepID=UPI000DF7B0B5|nr:ArsR family transcriptional regulator [Saliphagus sp. LR7]
MDADEERLCKLLADSTNRTILTVLNEAAQDLSVNEIATELVSRNEAPSQPTDEDRLQRVMLSLHHNHLPRLAEAGVIRYNRDTHRVRYGAHTAVEPEWQELAGLDELLSRVRTKRKDDESEIGILEGREEVYEYCRGLADKAENELFLIYTSEELLDEACLPHAKHALDRGVDFHAGAKGADTRTFFRECLPEATVWDPQFDWMNNDSRELTISRLVFADRERVAIGLWDDSPSGGTKTELAMIGEGSTNPLVVLARELLGTRLDHLDYQSDDFLEGLPFET